MKVEAPKKARSLSHVVLGAGPAGLVTARELSRHGVPVVVLEKSQVVGGLARTEVRDGFRFDLGGHRFFTKKPELNDYLTEVLGDELVDVTRKSHVFFDGKKYRYPLEPINVLWGMGMADVAFALADFGRAQLSAHLLPHKVETFEDWVIWKFGRTLYERFFRSYTEKVWGIPCNTLSAEWASQRIRQFDLGQAVLAGLGLQRRDKHTTLVERFRYPRTGYGRIAERLAQDCRRYGAQLLLGQQIVSLRHNGRRIVAAQVADGRTYPVHTVTSSIPWSALCRLLQPQPPEAVLQAAGRLCFRDLIIVHVRLNAERVTDDTWSYIQDAQCRIGRIHEPKNWSTEMVDSPNHTSLVCELFCTRGDVLWRSTDAELGEIVVSELADTLHVIPKNIVLGWDVVRVGYAYPVLYAGYESVFDQVRGYFEAFENLHLVGRSGMYRYHNVDHVLETGILAARNILAGTRTFDVFRVNADSSYHEDIATTDPLELGA